MTYDPRYHQRTSNLEDEIAGYAGYENAVVTQRTHRPARQLRNTKQAIIAERLARQQVMDEARTRQRNVQGTTRIPPDAYPKVRQRTAREDDELYEDEDLYTRPPRSAVRFQPEETYQSGNTRLHVQEVVIPKRRSAGNRLLLGRSVRGEPEIYGDDPGGQETARPQHRRRPKIHLHALVWLGLGMIAMIFLWTGFSYVINWWQVHQDDSTYGRPRTFQINAVVGHNDSETNPSHFIALNLNRHVIVIELPGGDPTKARIYPITILFGDGQELTPVTLLFKDVTGNGRLDMEIHIQDQTIVMVNDNGGFRPLRAGEKVHL